MKGFKEFIGESREESSRPVLDEILSRAERPNLIIDYFEKELGPGFLEFSRESETGENIAQEFSPKWNASQKKYRSYIGSKSGFQYYYFTNHPNGTTALAIRSTDWTTWWIGQDTLSKIDPLWLINTLLADF